MGSRSESNRRAWERKKALWEASPGELVELQKHGTVSETLKGCAVLAQKEALGLVSALGGADNVSEQRMVLIQDVARLGLVLRAVVARFLQGDGDPELASRVATITSARRSSLQALGLERISKELDLAEYLKRKAAENSAQEPIGDEPEHCPAAESVRVAADEGDVLVTEEVPLTPPAAALNNDSNEPPTSGE
jgi:hypothetical protein